MKRFLWLGFVLLLHLICTGCGDTFRPIIIPNPPTFPNPAAAHSVVAISDNGTTVAGSVTVIDVSGDSIASVADCTTPLCIGIAPVHAVQQTAGQVLVVNQAVTGLAPPPSGCLVTVGNQVFNVCPSITKVNFSSITTIANTTTITLPAGSAPNFVAVAPNQNTAYVTLPNYVPDPINFPNGVVPSVGVVNTTSNLMSATVPVVYTPPGNTPVLSNPYALAVTPDNTKLYVANKGTLCGSSPPTPCSFSVSAFNTVGPSSRSISGSSLSSPPLWLSARSDSQAVYVLEASGTLAYISITSTSGPDTLTETAISVPTAVKLVYDSNLNRLYIPGEAFVEVNGKPVLESAVMIVDASQSAPSPIVTIPIAAVPPSSRVASDPCSGTSITTLNTVDVAALPDGTRAYVGSFYEDAAGNICPQVTVIDAKSNTANPPIAVPGFPAYDAFCSTTRFRFMMAAGGDSLRAYLSSCDGGNVHIIDTSNDTYNGSLSAPPGSRFNNPPQNPVFLFAGP
jgi:hypothetical protein